MNFRKAIVLFLVLMVSVSGVWAGGEQEADNVVRIGWYGPLTGPSSLIGNASQNGLRLAADEINKSGGINGMMIELKEYDDKSSPEQAVKAVTKMVDVDNVHCIVGSLHSGNILAAAPISEKALVPQIGCGTSPKWLEQGHKYLFRALPNNTWANKGLVATIEELGMKKVGMLYRSDEYGKTGASNIKDLIGASSVVNLVGEESYQPGDIDFTGQFAKLLNSGADSIVLYSLTDEAGIQMKQLRRFGYTGYIFGAEGFASPDVLEVGGDSSNGTIFGCAYVIPETPEDALSEKEKAFLKGYVDMYGGMPESDCAYRTYDSIYLFKDAIERAGTLDGTAVRDALENTEYEGLVGTFDYKGNMGEGIHGVRMFIIDGGKINLLEEYLKTR